MSTVTDLQRIAISLAAALALSATCIAGAIAPARADAATRLAARTLRPARLVTGPVGAVRY